MSRAAWAGLLMLGGGLGLIVFLLTEGLSDEARAASEAALAAIERSEAAFTDAEQSFEAAVEEDSAFLGDLPEIKEARARLGKQKTLLTAARGRADGELAALLEADKASDGDAVISLSRDIAEDASKSLAGVTTAASSARQLLAYKKDHSLIVETARQRITAAPGLANDAGLTQQIALGATTCPDAKGKLEARQQKMGEHAAQIAASGAELERLAAQSPVPYVAAGRTAEAIGAGFDKLGKMRADLKNDVASLSKSVDKILVDMKREDGKYYQKHKFIENGVSRTTGWMEVTPSVYNTHRDHLGMSLYSKPECVLEEDAQKVAAPPGYNYVGNTRYGYWDQSGGRSFWVFYGQYALMRDLLWGGRGRYSPIYRTNYRSYRSTTRSGKPFFGSKKQYGTKGSLTKTRYSNSNYYKQARRTTYSGSRYGGSRSSGSRYSGSRSSGSRSRYSGGGSGSRYRGGGSRGSRYRSSSFGGSGK